ncbi:MAG: TonB-dependent receptor [Zymomonas mobilis subsp. pomaceae]|uniref:TonB-dependent receptor n=1 Tax=Zymomonas mobilis subsp. pomaceae (strain ATCC 29192 / DSM 22645 / JCM 10191 / CCUG 17912 / NBRC 13757 / NCIMB 11200 / NRRL B-4491 / Barker I) TaxID=579138 RepID=F8EV94_ZYMMT|nr:TonB-dependent receptor [Zymomonas mobilis]AEI38312.1 TonB-dependent receptor [Zymomonas mobilis subsp. pomaceae ATCC 29192]MDX5948001.1 TonB-dependent receptor [Zymomonas mobilis subsp. pomaceae]GEB89331.1 TonB-dependent receptor [Zymomonas mobilis subsp. pomaceae]
MTGYFCRLLAGTALIACTQAAYAQGVQYKRPNGSSQALGNQPSAAANPAPAQTTGAIPPGQTPTAKPSRPVPDKPLLRKADITQPRAKDDGAGGLVSRRVGRDDIANIGFGQSRQQFTITGANFSRMTPGTSALSVISTLPGVNYQSADSFGLDEKATSLYIHGFSQNQIGFTIDGVPLGNMMDSSNGLSINRMIMPENIDAVTVNSTSGSLGLAANNNVGGSVQFISHRPGDKLDIVGSGTYGSNNTWRGFTRVETGDLTGNGLRGSFSYGYLTSGKTRGWGKEKEHQVNAKIVQDLHDGYDGEIGAFFDYSSQNQTNYMDTSYDMQKRLGTYTDYTHNWGIAEQMASAYQSGSNNYPAPYSSVNDTYYSASTLRRDYIGGLHFKRHLTKEISVDVTGYYNREYGQDLMYDPYVSTPGGSSLSVQGVTSTQNRGGITGHVAWDHDFSVFKNHLEAGGWYESSTSHQATDYYDLAANASGPSRNILQYQNDPFSSQWAHKIGTETTMYYVSDRMDFGKVTLSGGWKGFQTTSENKALGNLSDYNRATGKMNSTDWFLPQFGILWKPDSRIDFFFNYSENMQALNANLLAATSQANFDSLASNRKMRPEKSTNYEIGMRYHEGRFQTAISGYYSYITNNMLATSTTGNAPINLYNVGGVKNYGVDVSAMYRVLRPLSFLASYSYTHATYANNIMSSNGSVLYQTKGNWVPGIARNMFKADIVYDDHHLLMRVGANFMVHRSVDFMDTVHTPGQYVLNGAIGYHFGDEVPYMKNWTIIGNVTNMTGQRYVSTIGTTGFAASGDAQNLQAGAPRRFFITLKRGL